MEFTKHVFDLTERSDADIAKLFRRHQISLTVDEGRSLQTRILLRPPSLAELILFSIEGSEHCSYKSSRPYLKQFMTEADDVVLGAKEDAGVIRVARDHEGRGYCVVMSHESHNHPSQVVPYEGAATGVGGNVRDVCCMGAQVIALADDLRFGSLESPKTAWLFEQVVSGIGGYGNPIGVPSLAGGVQFDPGYQDNCLVTVVSLGILPESRLIHSYAPEHSAGYDLILVGKPTDNSGFGGASFASFELEEEKHEQNKGAVQEPNAFLGRHMIQASQELFEKLESLGAIDRVGFKDLGAGGIACASVELADTGGYGARVDLDLVHTSMEGLPPQVILCAETQERYMWVSPPDLTGMILEHYNSRYALPEVSRGAEARVIGCITEEPRYVVHGGGEILVDAPAQEVTRGFLYHREVGEYTGYIPSARKVAPEGSYQDILLELLSHENLASTHPIWDSYDKQVQGRTLCEAGEEGAGVLTPFSGREYPEEIRNIGITLTTDQNPRFNRLDAYHGAVLAVAESVTNTIASGAEPIAISDCLCYGNPEKPNQMAQFVQGCSGTADAARALGIPIIAGNVSLYNESRGKAIPPSPMIACLGKLEYAPHVLRGGFTQPGSLLYYLSGCTGRAVAGSLYGSIIGETGGTMAECSLEAISQWGRVITRAAARQTAASCRDLSEGGIAAALCEMSFPGDIGCSVTLPAGEQLDEALFGEGPGWIIEITEDQREAFLQLCSSEGLTPEEIGRTEDSGRIRINNVIDIPIQEACQAWRGGLERRLM